MSKELNIFTVPGALEKMGEQQEPMEGAWINVGSSQWAEKATGGVISWRQEVEIPEKIYKFLYGETKIILPEVPTGKMPIESRIDKLLDSLSEKNKIIDTLRLDIEKSDTEFSKTLDRVLYAFIFIFLIMVYLFLIK